MPPKNASRNEKDRKRRADGLLRHQAEIDHLHGSLTGVLGQMENSKGVADIIRDYQKSIQPWDDNEPVDLEECRGCGGRGIRDGVEIDCAARGDLPKVGLRVSRERACLFARADRNSSVGLVL